MATTVQSRALRKAAELVGGQKILAERLGVKVEDIEKWIAGTRRTPRDVFLGAVDLILDELPSVSDSSDPSESPPTQSSAPVSHYGFE
jgi:Putative antitoxin of bacterial toxin-antitoxin system, YdaS/YdaT